LFCAIFHCIKYGAKPLTNTYRLHACICLICLSTGNLQRLGIVLTCRVRVVTVSSQSSQRGSHGERDTVMLRDGESDPGADFADLLQSRRVLAVSGSRALSCIRVCNIHGSMPTSGDKADLDSYCTCCLLDICWNSVISNWNARRYGHKTWEWAAGLRGYLHPLLFAALYKVQFSL